MSNVSLRGDTQFQGTLFRDFSAVPGFDNIIIRIAFGTSLSDKIAPIEVVELRTRFYQTLKIYEFRLVFSVVNKYAEYEALSESLRL